MIDAEGTAVAVNDVVQLSPDKTEGEFVNGFFAGCYMHVTEVHRWGVQGFISMPGTRNELPGAAYFRAKSANFIRVGKAAWELHSKEEEKTDG